MTELEGSHPTPAQGAAVLQGSPANQFLLLPHPGPPVALYNALNASSCEAGTAPSTGTITLHTAATITQVAVVGPWWAKCRTNQGCAICCLAAALLEAGPAPSGLPSEAGVQGCPSARRHTCGAPEIHRGVGVEGGWRRGEGASED